jgi:hypothetical protein
MALIVKEFQEYVETLLDLQVHIRTWEIRAKLPLFLREGFDFHKATILGTDLLLAVSTTAAEQSPATVQKQLARVREVWDHDVVYVRGAITRQNRQRLISKRVPFVVPGNQMYLPMLGIDLREHFRTIGETKSVVSPVTQALLLAVLYARDTEPVTPTRIAGILNYTPMSVGRAFGELERLGLGLIDVKGKNRELRFMKTGVQLWEAALPFLRTPARKRVFMEGAISHTHSVKAGETALAHYSSIAEPGVPVYALTREDWKELRHKRTQELPGPEPGSIEIEIWDYDPRLFQKKYIADRLSVYLSLRESTDERVQAGLEEMMRGMTW